MVSGMFEYRCSAGARQGQWNHLRTTGLFVEANPDARMVLPGRFRQNVSGRNEKNLVSVWSYLHPNEEPRPIRSKCLAIVWREEYESDDLRNFMRDCRTGSAALE